MKNLMSMVVVPMGYSEKVIRAANKAGALGATVIRARGAGHKGVLFFQMDSEEEIVLITANEKTTNKICKRINNDIIKSDRPEGHIFILPIDCK